MKLTIKNVGKINNAQIEIEGITTLIGVNGTGKSTINKSLYCILNAFCNTSYKILDKKVRKVRRIVDNLVRKMILNSKEINRYTNKWAWYSKRISDEILEQYQQMSINDKIDENTVKECITKIYEYETNIENLQEDIEYIVQEINKKEIEYVEEIINRQFLTEFNEQINYLDEKNTAEITLQEEDTHIYVKFEENRVTENSETKEIQFNPIYIDTPYILDYYGTYGYFREYEEEHGEKLIATFRKKITDEDNIDNLQQSTQRLKKVKEMLNKIVEGNFSYDENGDITYENKVTKSKLELANLATGLKTFVIIKKLVENGTIDENTVLIIDEPEVHLHPEWQLKLAEILVNLNKELNIKILISTHSPYFLRAIQVYCAKYEMANKERIYYIKNGENGLSTSEEITGDTAEIFEQLTKPFIELEEEVQS